MTEVNYVVDMAAAANEKIGGGAKAEYFSTAAVEVGGEALSPTASLFHSPKLNCCIIAALGCKTAIDPAAVKLGLERTLIRHPRFSSRPVVGPGDHGWKASKLRWERTIVDLDDHVIIPNLDDGDEGEFITTSPDSFVEDYISRLTTFPMDLTKPLWELHILNVRTRDAESLFIFKIHHSVGDGASLISLLLACARKCSDPDALPSLPVKNRAPAARRSGEDVASSTSGFCWSLVLLLWAVVRLVWNTLVDVMLVNATVLFLRDTETPIKAPARTGEGRNGKRFAHRTVSLDDIKMVKNAMNMTINDVVLGVTEAGISRYLNRKYGEKQRSREELKQSDQKSNLPTGIRLRACILVNMRPTPGIEDMAELMAKDIPKAKWGWGNWLGAMMIPLTIALRDDDPLEYLRSAKDTMDRKKHSLEPILTFIGARVLPKLFGVKVTAGIFHNILFNTTLAFSNVVGPMEEISLYGHPIAYIAPSVYGHPHALTIHFQSYCNTMTIAVAVDPEVIFDPHVLCDEFERSLRVITKPVTLKYPDKRSHVGWKEIL